MVGKTRRAFTYVDLIVLVLVLAMLAAMAPAQFGASRERSNRIKCASNLRQIGQALMLYSQGDQRSYPRVRYDTKAPCPTDTDSRFTSADPAAAAGKDPFQNRPSDVTAAMFLLVRTQDLSTEVFVCPTSNQEKDTMNGSAATNRINFTDPQKNVSYSVANPYPTESAIARGYKWSPNVEADWAIAADRNDGRVNHNATSVSDKEAQQPMNGSNHGLDGQNVLYNDGHVEWYATVWAGSCKDNIYTRALAEQTRGGEWSQVEPARSDPEAFPDPAERRDTVLLPVFPTPSVIPGQGVFGSGSSVMWIVVGIAVLIGAIYFCVYFSKKKKARLAASPAAAFAGVGAIEQGMAGAGSRSAGRTPAPPAEPTAIVPDTSALWYVASGGSSTGPYTWQQVQEMASSGHIQPTDHLCTQKNQTWVPAGRVRGLWQ